MQTIPSSNLNRLRIKNEYQSWLNQLSAQVIFTGTIRLVQTHYSDRAEKIIESITPEKIEKKVEYFIKKISRRLFGTKSIKEGIRLRYAGMIEGCSNPNRTGQSRFHVHIGISGIPKHIDLTAFAEFMEQAWDDGRWGYGDSLAEPCYGDQWKRYVLKQFQPSKTEYFITNSAFEEQK